MEICVIKKKQNLLSVKQQQGHHNRQQQLSYCFTSTECRAGILTNEGVSSPIHTHSVEGVSYWFHCVPLHEGKICSTLVSIVLSILQWRKCFIICFKTTVALRGRSECKIHNANTKSQKATYKRQNNTFVLWLLCLCCDFCIVTFAFGSTLQGHRMKRMLCILVHQHIEAPNSISLLQTLNLYSIAIVMHI